MTPTEHNGTRPVEGQRGADAVAGRRQRRGSIRRRGRDCRVRQIQRRTANREHGVLTSGAVIRERHRADADAADVVGVRCPGRAAEQHAVVA